MALPAVTSDDRTTLYLNADEIQLIPLRDAHTDGDTAVRFVAANVLMTGDVFRSIGYPNIDRNNGGTLKGMLAALTLLVETAGAITTVIPGHGEITNRAAIIAHRDMAMMVRDRVAKLLSEGADHGAGGGRETDGGLRRAGRQCGAKRRPVRAAGLLGAQRAIGRSL